MRRERRKRPIDPRHYSDILILFLLRLQEIEEREFHKRFRYSLKRVGGQITEIEGTDVDEEYLISYLAVVRQLMLHKEPTCLENVRRILYGVADQNRLPEVASGLDELRDRFEKWKVGVRFSFSGGDRTFENWNLIDLWLHDRYFHTDLDKLYLFYHVPAHAVELGRKMMQVYVHAFVEHALSHRRLVLFVLAKGVLARGQFDTAPFTHIQEFGAIPQVKLVIMGQAEGSE